MPLDRLWVTLMEIGFVGYLTSLVILIVKGINPDGSLRKAQAARWAAIAAAMFVLWAYALYRA